MKYGRREISLAQLVGVEEQVGCACLQITELRRFEGVI